MVMVLIAIDLFTIEMMEEVRVKNYITLHLV